MTSLQPWDNLSRYVVLRASCQLVTVANSCNETDRSSLCWDRAIGVDLRTGRLTFNTSLVGALDEPHAALGSADSTYPLSLSSSGDSVYWSRLLLPRPTSDSTPGQPVTVPSAPAQSCGEVLAFTVRAGNVSWRYRTCSDAAMTFASLIVFPALSHRQSQHGDSHDDVLLIMQTTEMGSGRTSGMLHAHSHDGRRIRKAKEDEKGEEEEGGGREARHEQRDPSGEWATMLGSSGQLLRNQSHPFNGSRVWDCLANDAASGVFTVWADDTEKMRACSMRSDGTWIVSRLYESGWS